MSKREEWEVWEEEVQQLLSLRGTVCSGNKFYDPSDGVDRSTRFESDFLIMVDSKYTKHSSYRVEKKLMSQWVEKAQSMGYRFALPIRLGDSEGDYVVLPFHDYVELVDSYRNTQTLTREETSSTQFFSEEEVDLLTLIAKKAPLKVRLRLLQLVDKMQEVRE